MVDELEWQKDVDEFLILSGKLEDQREHLVRKKEKGERRVAWVKKFYLKFSWCEDERGRKKKNKGERRVAWVKRVKVKDD